MDLSVKNYSQSFGSIMPSKIINNNGALSVKSAAGKVIQVLEDKPNYLFQSHKKVIQYPVLIDGKPELYNVRYNVSQHHIHGVGLEIQNAKKSDYKFISAREIAKDLDKKAEMDEKRANGVKVFYRA